jgi:excinuclease ABC subunit C
MLKISDHIEKILKNLPKSSWVYQMKDKSGKVMYVGKAKILRNRVVSYFKDPRDLSMAKRQMVAKIADIEIITCATEVEALVLETNLIKHLTPKYNILMKDDKNLSYLKITNSPVPELVKTRQKIRDGWEYYGPYVAWAEQSARALRKIFKIRNCRMKFAREKDVIKITDKAGKTIPCMDYYIGLCPAPCLLESSKIAEHKKHIDGVRAFLRWDTVDLFSRMERDMRSLAGDMQFEKAWELKDTLEALRWLGERQKVRDIVEWDIDVYVEYEKYDKRYIALTQVRSSQIVWVFRHEVVNSFDDDIVVQFLTRQYLDAEDLPDLILSRAEIVDEAFLEFLRWQKISIEYPQIGPKNDLLTFTLTQLREYAYKREIATLENKTLTREYMANVLTRLGYEVPKKWEIVFECYDISHTDGHFTYASRVAIVNGKPDPSRYKKYKIKSLEDGEIDDYASHREVMIRRTIEGLELNNLPHLIIIDWGKWQLSSAISGIKEGIWQFRHSEKVNSSEGWREATLECEGRIQVSDNVDPHPQGVYWLSQTQDDRFTGLEQSPNSKIPTPQHSNIPICSIAKREEEIFIPGDSTSIMFEKWTPELMVLQKARDESHRFSITANRSARMKSMKKNILEEIPSIGPVTRKKLLKLAGSVSEIKNLSEWEIEKICTKIQMERLRDHGLY